MWIWKAHHVLRMVQCTLVHVDTCHYGQTFVRYRTRYSLFLEKNESRAYVGYAQEDPGATQQAC